ncbi:hypothetical protein M9H77_21905 [Catharanthus roseus]|uniref:Uncharacterized protein n=1 Tax=Catharanthus roseus TaxID=4058 RepID=A0ACC0ARH3_CATRO|nr:hypothetical protein M9H77_21905 [Catharanthus roseus]
MEVICSLISRADDYIIWYRDITRVYIDNLANRDTRTIRYQPVGVDRRMMTSTLHEVDDMDTGVLEGPPSSPTQFASFAKKVQTIIHRCMSVVLVELRGALVDCLVAGHVEDALLPLLIRADEDMQTPGMEEREAPPLPGTVGSSFQAPPPPGRTGSFTLHMPISYASSSNSYAHDDERTDNVTLA